MGAQGPAVVRRASASTRLRRQFLAITLRGRAKHAVPVLMAALMALVWSLAGPIHPAHAADVLWRLSHGDQDVLVMGTLVAATEGQFSLSNAHSLAGLPVPAEMRIHSAGPAISWPLGSTVIVSVDQSGRDYEERWGVFLASSSGPPALTILDGSLAGGERAAFQRYINSEGRDSEFAFVDGRVYVKKADGSLELIYSSPGTPSSTVTTTEPTPASGWDLRYLAGAAGVLVLILILFRLRPRPPQPPAGTTPFPDTAVDGSGTSRPPDTPLHG